MMEQSPRLLMPHHATSTSKTILIAALVLILYLETFVSRATNIPAKLALDMLVIVVAAFLVVKAFFRKRLRRLHLLLLFNIVIFTVLSLFGGLHPGLMISLLSAIIFSKFIIVFLLAGKFEMQDLKLAIHLLAGVHLIGCLANLVAPDYFVTLLPRVSYQIDTSALMGLSLNSNRSAAVSAALFLYFLYFERNRPVSVIFLALLALTGSRSLVIIAGLLAGFMFFISDASLSKRFTVSLIAIAAAVAFTLFSLSIIETFDIIDKTIFEDARYIRAAMLAGGYSLANDFFPLGVGGGQFGSSLSEGSQAYRLVGIAHWPSVVYMWGVFDSGAGAILGEYGWLGLAAYLVVVLNVLRSDEYSDLPFAAALFFLGLIILMNLVRTVSSDFFFSFFFLFTYSLAAHQYRMAKAK